jgi:hypothetical protein
MVGRGDSTSIRNYRFAIGNCSRIDRSILVYYDALAVSEGSEVMREPDEQTSDIFSCGTVGGDKKFDVRAFVAAVRALEITPHVAQKVVGTAIDGCTTRHPGYAISQQKRKLIEQVFGWMKTVDGLRKLRHRRGERVDWIVTFTAAAYDLIRLRTLLASAIVADLGLSTRPGPTCDFRLSTCDF